MITHNRLFWSGRTAHVNGLIDICKVHNPLFFVVAGRQLHSRSEKKRRQATALRKGAWLPRSFTPLNVAAATENIRVN